jgi:hypothetical protein
MFISPFVKTNTRYQLPASSRLDASLVKGPLSWFGLRCPVGHVLNSVGVAGVVRKNLREALLTTRGLLHSLPEKHGFIGVVARKGHQEQADVVRFRFFFA